MASRPLPAGLAPSRLVDLANDLNSRAIHLLRRISMDDAADGVTAARASALSVLVYGGASTLGDLARRERVATPTMSRLIDAMVREGLVTRETVPDNRRTLRLEASARGRELTERGRARRISRLADDLAVLSDRDLRALERAVVILGRLSPPPAPPAPTASAREPKTAAGARHAVPPRPRGTGPLRPKGVTR
jgi:DNA-binding MarR family transcriptional regulator